jgi:hypothetical protein
MTPEIFLALLSIAGASVPFALDNQMNNDGIFSGYKVFRCHCCLTFWLALITIALMGGNPVYAGLAPIFAQLIHKTLY